MKKVSFFLFAFLFALSFMSCEKARNPTDAFVGTWAQTNLNSWYTTGTPPVTTPDVGIEITLAEDFTYTTLNEIPLGIFESGTWSYDEASKTISFDPDPNFGILIGHITTHAFVVETITDSEMNVNYETTYKNDVVTETQFISIVREFEKIK